MSQGCLDSKSLQNLHPPTGRSAPHPFSILFLRRYLKDCCSHNFQTTTPSRSSSTAREHQLHYYISDISLCSSNSIIKYSSTLHFLLQTSSRHIIFNNINHGHLITSRTSYLPHSSPTIHLSFQSTSIPPIHRYSSCLLLFRRGIHHRLSITQQPPSPTYLFSIRPPLCHCGTCSCRQQQQ